VGIDYAEFNRKYLEYLTDYYLSRSTGLREPQTYGERLTSRDLLPVFNTHPAFSPDGKSVAYVTDRRGRPEVALVELATGEHRFVAGRQWRRLEYLHAEGRALSFSPDGRWLAFCGEKEQRDFLYLYDIKRDRLRRVRTPFEHVRSPAFHPDGSRLAVVGMKKGRNDLYEITPRGKLLRRLTETVEDEGHPAYSPDGRFLAYSLEVPTAHWAERNIAAIDLVTLSTAVLTDLPGSESTPVFTPDGRSLLFAAEIDGISNLVRLDLSAGKAEVLTRVIGGHFTPDVAPDGRLVFSSFRRGSHDLYLADPSLWRIPAAGLAALPEQPAARSWPAPGVLPENPPAEREPTPAGPAARRESDPLTGSAHPYRFRASTDLFFPVLFYSSTDGLFIATYWQASEYLGNHQLQTAVQYASSNEFLDYQVRYLYQRFRPQFFIGSAGETFYRDFGRTEQRRESENFGGVAYPLDRFHRVETVVGLLHRQDSYERLPQLNYEERENFASISWLRDTTTGRYLAVTDGSRFRLTYREARPYFGGDRDYKSHFAEYHQFRPTGRESTLALRVSGGVSTGPSPQLTRLGGIDRIRGYSRRTDANHAARFVFSNLEWRVPVKYLNWRTWFLFPDFSVKAIYGTLFTDAGYDWTSSDGLNDLRADRMRHSVGGGIRLPIFILQTFPITVSMDVAKRTDADTWVWYLSLGPPF
jgi:TolB protein